MVVGVMEFPWIELGGNTAGERVGSMQSNENTVMMDIKDMKQTNDT